MGKFLPNLVLLIFLNLLVKPFYILGIDAEIQNVLGPRVYGDYFALLNFSFLFNILLDLGITNYNNRAVSRDQTRLVSRMGDLIGIKLGLVFLYVVVSALVAIAIGFDGKQWEILGILLFNQVLVSMLLFLRSNLGALQLFVRDSVVSVMDRFLLIIFCSVLLWGGWRDEFQIEWFVYGQTGAYGVALLTAWFLLPSEGRRIRIKFSRSEVGETLKRSIPFALLILLMMIYSRTDSVMLERLLDHGKTETGIYALGYRLLDASNMFAMLFAVLLLPIFSRMIKKREDIGGLLSGAVKMMFAFAIPLIALCFLYDREILELRYLGVNQQAAETFGLLMLSFAGICCTYTFGTLLTANGSLKQLNIMAVTAIMVNIGLNLYLIPEYGAKGAAFATLVTQALTAIVQFVLAQYIFKFEVIKSLLLPLGAYTILCFGLILGFNHLHGWDPGLVALVYLACLLLAWLTRNLELTPLWQRVRASRSEEDTTE